jgi:primosomal replication protein N
VNRFTLVAQVIERDVLRYTPAGIPIVSVKLLHNSNQIEAGVNRVVEFEMTALGVGEISKQLNYLDFNTPFQFSGFLARKSRHSKALVFHIDCIEHIETI